MSLANSSKRSSKGNLIITYEQNKTQKSHKSPIGSKRKDSDAKKEGIKFEKTEEKLKKNLMKQFQTFNQKNEEGDNKEDDKARHVRGEKSSKKKDESNSKVLNAQMTTQAKSPFMKSGPSSKAKLTIEKVEDQGSAQVYKMKGSSKKGFQSLSKERSRSPIQEIEKSRKSSPDMRKLYSKHEPEDRKAFSKVSNITKDKQQAEVQNRSRKVSTAKSTNNKEVKGQQTKGKEIWKLLQSQQSPTGQNLHLTFPQMITQSQSVYPSSSYPNTGKESNNNMRRDDRREVSEKDREEDYIDEDGLGQEQEEEQEQEENSNIEDFEGSNYRQLKSGYKQLPESYIMAMQILQKQLHQKQSAIKKLQKQLTVSKNTQVQLNETISNLHQQLSNKDEIIKERQQEIKFLKGYLDEEKNNNRQALKEVAKNVYERSVEKMRTGEKGEENILTGKKERGKQRSVSKRLQFQDNNDRIQLQSKNNRNQYQNQNYQNKNNRGKQQNKNDREEYKNKNDNRQEQSEEEDDENWDLVNQIHKSRKHPYIQQSKPSGSNSLSKSPLQQPIQQAQVYTNNLIADNLQLQTQLKQQQANQQLVKQQLLRKQILRQQMIKDELMRQSILRQQQERKRLSLNKRAQVQYGDNNRLKFNYLEEDGKLVKNYSRDRISLGKQPHTAKKTILNQQQRLFSHTNTDHKRIRSLSTAQHHNTPNSKLNPNITYRPQAPINSHPAFSLASHNPNPSTQSVMDPVLQRYINSKCQLSPEQKLTKSIFPPSLCSLNSLAAKQSISQMRELMRHQKQLIALNYKLEAIQQKILQCVKSNKTQQHNPSQQNQLQNKFKLQQLQKTYRLLKKQFQKKQLITKDMKRSLQHVNN